MPVLIAAFLLPAGIVLHAVAAVDAQSSFRDVPANSSLSTIVTYLKTRGILSGYDDGTFRPDSRVNRAEALKILVNAKGGLGKSSLPASGFTDVADASWFAPFVAYGLQVLHIIDGPPKAKTFAPDKTIREIEFLKMLFSSQGVPTDAFSDIALPLSIDAQDASAWYYPYARYGIASSVIQIDTAGSLQLSKELTRGDIANLLYRFFMYKDGRRTQALLTEEETELMNVLQMLQQKDLSQAQFAASRALLAARGAKESKPALLLVSGAVKIAEAFQQLVTAYKVGTEGRFDETVALAQTAWKLADQAERLSPQLQSLSGNVKQLSKNIADEARKAGGLRSE